ncbi:MAG: glutathione peroxidase, partial [Tannerellaceae bacterium]|nr:glutathione peroxidase [Tannerellaceae bacterium]
MLFLTALLIPVFASAQSKNFHSFTVQSITGETVSLSAFKGKKVLVVNVASKCG